MIDTPTKTTIDPDTYHTPFCAQHAPDHLSQHTRIFKSAKRKHKRHLFTYQYLNQQEQTENNQKYQKTSFIKLAEWLRWSAVSLGLAKHVFDNALAVMKQGSQKI